jgi:hypothetical protein
MRKQNREFEKQTRYPGLTLDSFVVGACLTLSTFGRAEVIPGVYFPPFGEPLVTLIIYGRYIALATLMIWVAFRLVTTRSIDLVVFPHRGPLLLLWLIQGVFLLKILDARNIAVATLGIASLIVQFCALHMYVYARERRSWVQAGAPSQFVSRSISIFAVLFLCVNLYALRNYPLSSFTPFGRFFGTMVNPQHLMMCAVLASPALWEESKTPTLPLKILAWFAIGGLGFLVYETGSRSGLLAMATVALISNRHLFRGVGPAIFSMVLSIIIIGAGIELWSELTTDFVGRFVDGRSDTRSEIWQNEIDLFLQYPILGVPVNADGRLEFVESLWLSVATNGGIAAAILALIMLVRMLRITATLSPTKTSARSATMYLSSMAAILLLSIFESVFMGLATGMAMLSIMYLAGAEVADRAVRRARLLARQEKRTPPARKQWAIE